jgi:hypothetical protein
MRRFPVLVALLSLGLVGPVGLALADGPGAGYSGEKIAKVRFISVAPARPDEIPVAAPTACLDEL